MKYYNYLSRYIELVLIPYLLVNEILFLYKNNKLDISYITLIHKIKKIINIKDINYHKVITITNNILLTKYNYKVIKNRPITISYVINK